MKINTIKIISYRELNSIFGGVTVCACMIISASGGWRSIPGLAITEDSCRTECCNAEIWAGIKKGVRYFIYRNAITAKC